MPETSDNAYSNYNNSKNKEGAEEPVDEDFWYESEEEESFDEESLMDENMDDQFEDDDEEEEDDEDEDMGGK